MDRRTVLKMGGLALSGRAIGAARAVSLFDGNTLDGWIQAENSWTSLQGVAISDPAGFIGRLMHGRDAIAVFLRERLQDAMKATLAGFGSMDGKAQTLALSALGKEITVILAGPAPLPPATRSNLTGAELARRNRQVLESAFPAEIVKAASTGWVVKDGAMASTGSGRGVIYTAQDYGRFRLMFTMRHVSGNPDHQACVLIFCTRPKANEVPLDALAGIQFQVPNGGRWDYRPGMNSNGGAEFTSLSKTKFSPGDWNRVEILADASKGEARMTVNGVEMLEFRDPAAGKAGPIAWQMHNAGLFDEYKDVTIEMV